MKQNNQSSWAARLRKISALCLMLVTASSAWADDNVRVVSPLSIKAGQTKQVAVSLENTTAFTAFQMDIKLPAGLTIDESSIKSRRTSDATYHNILTGDVDGKKRVVAYSAKFNGSNLEDGNKPLTGESGDYVIYFSVTASEDYTGGSIEVSKAIFATASEGTELDNASSADDAAVIFGDVNGDKDVDGQDVTKFIQYYLYEGTDKIPAGFNKVAADMNFDGIIDGQDATKAINVYLYDRE